MEGCAVRAKCGLWRGGGSDQDQASTFILITVNNAAVYCLAV